MNYHITITVSYQMKPIAKQVKTTLNICDTQNIYVESAYIYFMNVDSRERSVILSTERTSLGLSPFSLSLSLQRFNKIQKAEKVLLSRVVILWKHWPAKLVVKLKMARD